MYRPRRKVGLQHAKILPICEFSAAQRFTCVERIVDIKQETVNMILCTQIAQNVYTVTDRKSVACDGPKKAGNFV